MVHLTTLAIVATLGGLGLPLGYECVAAVQLPVLVLAAIIGVWLFSVQHRSERTRWVRHDAWDPNLGSLAGCDLSAPADDPAMVHRQYRVSSCTSPEPARAELPAPGMPFAGRGTLRRSDTVPAGGTAGLASGSVGRGSRQDGDVPRIGPCGRGRNFIVPVLTIRHAGPPQVGNAISSLTMPPVMRGEGVRRLREGPVRVASGGVDEGKAPRDWRRSPWEDASSAQRAVRRRSRTPSPL